MTIQSAIYLTGNKRRLFEDIKPHLKGKKILIDLFSGSGTVAINAVNEGMFERVIANEGNKHLYDLNVALQSKYFLDMVAFSKDCYGETKDEYLRLREDYNNSHRLDLLLNLNYRSNSNMLRWNKSGGFNMPFGERECYNETRLEKHHEVCKGIEFHNKDFIDFIYDIKSEVLFTDCVVYLDPPYQSSCAVYNEAGGWCDTQDKALLDMMEYLQAKGAKVVMSNIFTNRGKENTWLIGWCERNNTLFDVHHLKISYGNSSFRKSKEKTDEVLIVSK